MLRRLSLVAAVSAALSACAGDPGAFYPETAGAERQLEERALAHVPQRYRVRSVTVVRAMGRSPGTDTEIIGYDAWVRVEGCSGYVLVRFDRWGGHRTTGDLTRCG